jgi:glycyl-tRNA synthetase beta chain
MPTDTLLIEIGCEELPPKLLPKLAQHLQQNIASELTKAELNFDSIRAFASPRRLAVLVQALQNQQPDKTIERRGPSWQAAFDAAGEPTAAALGFAQSCGVSLEQVEKLDNDKGSWLFCRYQQMGKSLAELLPNILQQALKKLPIPRAMRWGTNTDEFVRPVHWLVVMYGAMVIPCELFGVSADRITYGHRFHHPQPLSLDTAEIYASQLMQPGYVMADFAQRRDYIREKIQAASQALQATVVMDEDLLDEVTALVEWPVVLTGQFAEEFLEVPAEALISAMQSHQKCFPLRDQQQGLLPNFLLVSNIESTQPDSVITGNQRVMRARLADAKFFYTTDCQQSLASRVPLLAKITYQAKLGSVHDRVQRMKKLAQSLADELSIDNQVVTRIAELAKADLLTDMVGEFPELQGIMGYHYALHDGESQQVAEGIRAHYLPRFAGDQLPQTDSGAVVALADKLDTLMGIIGVHGKPKGDKDPFQLRRAAHGIVRIILEKAYPLDIKALLTQHYDLYPSKPQVIQTVLHFIQERLQAWYGERGVSADVFNAASALPMHTLLDFDQRVQALIHFVGLAEAESLAAANKRVKNILTKQAADFSEVVIEENLLTAPQEQILARWILEQQAKLQQLAQQGDYQTVLTALIALKQPIDDFFDHVMVMVEDAALRRNRLAILYNLRQLFLLVADISLLELVRAS